MRRYHVGQTALNKAGLLMKIVEYNGYENITVEFEDGVRISNLKCRQFKNGSIRHPDYKKGETQLDFYGKTMKIVKYIDSGNVIVEFENGGQTRTSYSHFKEGHVRNPKIHVGEVFTLKSGHTASVIGYNNLYDCDIQLENGKILRKVNYRSLRTGNLGGKYYEES